MPLPYAVLMYCTEMTVKLVNIKIVLRRSKKPFCVLLQSRLSVNAVTAGDYSRPVRIARFIADLDAGFRLLNLKNDALRRRYDALKYDLKKAEEVVYDLTVRGLVNRPAHTSAAAAAADPASVVPPEQTASKS